MTKWETVQGAPILSAMRVYEAGGTRSFRADFDAHLRHAFVVSTPRVFAMGRPVRLDAKEGELAEISQRFADPDCWFIWSAAGELRELVEVLPFRLPWIAFHRGGGRRVGPQRMRIYRWERLVALVRRVGSGSGGE